MSKTNYTIFKNFEITQSCSKSNLLSVVLNKYDIPTYNLKSLRSVQISILEPKNYPRSSKN